jgi:hypothetical protein
MKRRSLYGTWSFQEAFPPASTRLFAFPTIFKILAKQPKGLTANPPDSGSGQMVNLKLAKELKFRPRREDAHVKRPENSHPTLKLALFRKMPSQPRLSIQVCSNAQQTKG